LYRGCRMVEAVTIFGYCDLAPPPHSLLACLLLSKQNTTMTNAQSRSEDALYDELRSKYERMKKLMHQEKKRADSAEKKVGTLQVQVNRLSERIETYSGGVTQLALLQAQQDQLKVESKSFFNRFPLMDKHTYGQVEGLEAELARSLGIKVEDTPLYSAEICAGFVKTINQQRLYKMGRVRDIMIGR